MKEGSTSTAQGVPKLSTCPRRSLALHRTFAIFYLIFSHDKYPMIKKRF
jgi:hypothetical protein